MVCNHHPMPTSLKVAVRQLLKTPGFTLTVVATVAICLAANLAIFAVVDAVVIRALPFPRSDELVTLLNAYPAAGVERSSSSLANYYDRRAAMKSFSSMAISQEGAVTVGDVDAPTRVEIARISPGFFNTLGVPLAMGRDFTEDETRYGPDQVAILTDSYWRNHFGADPAILGKTFLNDGLKTTVVGVLPAGFRFLSSRAQFYRPDGHDANEATPQNRHSNNWNAVARLAPGATLVQAQQEMDAFNAVQLKDDPYKELVAKAGYRTTIRGLHDDHVREVRPMLVLLQCGVAFLFLIGAVNLANLFLIRASNRTKDLAVQRALGARAWDVAWGTLTETTLVALAGGVTGVILGAFGTRIVRLLGTDDLPLGANVRFDSRVALIGLAASALAGVLLALPTIWLGLTGNVAAGLRSESRSGTSGPGVQRMRQTFIVVQVALAFVLLSGAGLLTVSLKRILAVPPGFRPDHVYAGNIPLPWNSYRDTPPREAFVRRLLPAVQALPGVTGAAITTQLPFNGPTNDSAVTVMDEPVNSPVHVAYMTSVTADYWSAMHIPLRRGRFFTDSECGQKAHVVVVDQDFAERYWPNGDPIGKDIDKDVTRDPKKIYRIVGVVGSIKQTNLTEPPGHGSVYFPYPNEELNTGFFAVIVVSPLPEETLAPMVRKALYSIDRQIPLAQFRSMDARIADTVVTRRSPAILAGVFSLVALFLAAIGTYGVLSYVVSQRQREIGVRMALGAQPSQIQGQFLSLGLRLLAAGAAFGIAGSWLAGRAMQSILFNVPAIQLPTLAAALAVLGLVAVVACLIPARRASRVDPIVALRDN
jgi:predicted permease